MRKKDASKFLAFSILLTTITALPSFAQGSYISQKENTINSIRVNLDHSNDFFNGKVKSFRDMGNHWSDITVGKLVNFGVISGYQDGTFKPNNTITRAEFSSILAAIFQLKSDGVHYFEDTKNHWSKDAISAMLDNEIIIPIEYGGKYEPNKEITRIEMTKMIVRAMEIDSSSKTGQNTKFADDKDIKSAYKPYIILATENKIIGGYPDNTFRPNKTATRAEASTMLVNMMKIISESESEPIYEGPKVVTKANELPSFSFEELGLSGSAKDALNVGKEYGGARVERIIKADTNKFPIQMGNVVITGIEYSTKIFDGFTSIAVHGYAINTGDHNGTTSNYSNSGLRLGFESKNGTVVNKGPIYLEKAVYDKVSSIYPNATKDGRSELNQNFTLVYSHEFSNNEIKSIILNEAWNTTFEDGLMIDFRQIKGN